MAARTSAGATGISLSDLITKEKVRGLSGSTYFKRGEDYFRSGAVFNLAQQGEKITAKVVGTHTYKVAIWKSGRYLEYSCNCPLGYDDEFCKHCVATALAWIEKKDDGTIGNDGSLQDIASYLESMPKPDLVELVMKYAEEHDALRRALVLDALREGKNGLSLQSLRDEITALTEPDLYGNDDYDYYDEDSSSFDKNIEDLMEIVNTIFGMLKKESASKEVLDLLEHAIIRLDLIAGITDGDSRVIGLMESMFKFHHKGYTLLQLGKSELAERVLNMSLLTDLELFSRYRKALGADGTARLAALVREHLEREEQMPNDPPRKKAPGYARLMEIAKDLAAQTSDTELLILVRKKESPSIRRSKELIDLYTGTGRMDEAVAEAEEGIRLFGTGRNAALADFLVNVYAERGDHEKALRMLYDLFVAAQSVGSYRRLRKQAERAGNWNQWKQRALQAIREGEGKTGSQGDEYYDRPIIDILLADKDYESAWQEALAEGCSRNQWLALAEGRARKHPEDSLAVYTAQIEELLPSSTARAYEEIIMLMGKVRDLMEPVTFEEYLDELYKEYKSRRKFISLLDENFPRAGRKPGARR